MFKFLKLRKSISGDARRLVPFRSIIHKPLFVLIALVFSFVTIIPIKVNAAAPQIRPQFNPILDTDIVNFQDTYLQLDPAAQAAASLLFGAYVTEYAGLADYGYVFDEVPTNATLKERLIFIGDQVVDTIFLPYNMVDQLVLTPLINLGQGIINKVKGVNDVDDFYNDVLSSENYGLPYSPDIGFSLNQLLAREGGLYNWQFSESSWYDGYFHWNTSTASGTNAQLYNQYISDLPANRILANCYNNSYNGIVFGSDDVLPKFNLFIDTDDHTISFVNPYTINGTTVFNSSDYYTNGVFSKSNSRLYFRTITFDPSLFNSYASVAKYYLNLSGNDLFSTNTLIYISNLNGWLGAYVNNIDFLNNVIAGTSIDNAQVITNVSDLGFSQTDSLEVLNPIKDAVFDLKALVEEIVQEQPDPNYELPLKPIIYNITQVEGSPLTAEDLQGISFNVTPPESGIDIPVNAFLPMFDNGKGFISYMWYMTKPLITYTRSLLDALTFDSVDGFNASGPGYFVLGVAGLGLIGGVIVKFLL